MCSFINAFILVVHSQTKIYCFFSFSQLFFEVGNFEWLRNIVKLLKKVYEMFMIIVLSLFDESVDILVKIIHAEEKAKLKLKELESRVFLASIIKSRNILMNQFFLSFQVNTEVKCTHCKRCGNDH